MPDPQLTVLGMETYARAADRMLQRGRPDLAADWNDSLFVFAVRDPDPRNQSAALGALLDGVDLRVKDGKPCAALARVQWARQGLGGEVPGLDPALEPRSRTTLPSIAITRSEPMTPPAPSAFIPIERLESRIADAKPIYAPGEAVAEANRCLYCHDAPCVTACPTGIDIPGFIRKIATDNVRGSARTILSANLLGYSCARVCPVEVLCVGACVYNDWHVSADRDRPAPALRGGDRRSNGGHATALLLEGARRTARRSRASARGPASLACAGYLALEGVAVTLFEKRAVPGGLNTTGVAPYKMHVEGALLEVEFIRSLGRRRSRPASRSGVTSKAADLLRDYDAVFLGIGLGADSRLGIPGEDGPGVIGATAWIERMKLEPRLRRSAASRTRW